MEKVSITIDLAKIDKARINSREFVTGSGETVVAKDYKIDLVPLKEPKVIKEGSTWRMVKKYFVCDAPTKEEREAKKNTAIIGDGIVFEDLRDVAPKDESIEVPF